MVCLIHSHCTHWMLANRSGTIGLCLYIYWYFSIDIETQKWEKVLIIRYPLFRSLADEYLFYCCVSAVFGDMHHVSQRHGIYHKYIEHNAPFQSGLFNAIKGDGFQSIGHWRYVYLTVPIFFFFSVFRIAISNKQFQEAMSDYLCQTNNSLARLNCLPPPSAGKKGKTRDSLYNYVHFLVRGPFFLVKFAKDYCLQRSVLLERTYSIQLEPLRRRRCASSDSQSISEGCRNVPCASDLL